MSKELTKLSVGIGGDASGLASAFTESVGKVNEVAGRIMEVGSKLAEWVGIGAAIEVGRQAVDHLGEAIRSGFETADKIESAQIAMTALAGSAENASAIMQHLKNLASGSIIPLDELTSASRKLLAVGISADQLEPLLKSLGDVAAGTGTDVGEMAEMFVRVAAEGSVSSRVLREMGKQGLPVVAELAKHFNTTAEGVKAMAEAGQIGFHDLQTAFEGMSGPGGKFAGLMDAQASTVGGLMKRLATSLSFDFAEIAEQMEDAFDMKGSLQSVLAVLPSITTAITNGIAIIGPYIVKVRDWIWHGLGEVWATILPPLTNAVNFIVGVLPSMSAIIQETMTYIYGIFTDIWGSIYQFVQPIVSAIGEVVGAHWQDIIESTIGLANSVVNAVEGLFTEVFGIVKELWDAVIAVWDWACGDVSDTSDQTADANVSAFETMYNSVKWFVDGLKDFLNTAAYEMKHWQDVVQIAVDGEILGWVVLANQAEYIFTQVIPAILNWFANNWTDILADLGNYTMTTFSNLGKNIVSVMSNLPGLISGSVSFDQLWTPLTDGLKTQLKELPNIPERQIGDYEASLTDQLGKELLDYGTGLDQYLADQDKKTKDFSKHITGGIQKGLDNIKDPKPLKVLDDKDLNPKIMPTLTTDNLALTITPEIKLAKLVRVGTGDAGLASYVSPIIHNAVGGLPAGVGHPSAPVAPSVPSQNATNDDPMKVMASAMDVIRRYIVKWDTNPPLAAVSM
jgi:tape measure domain-containing protein